jgi:hypothetical protein
VNSRNARPTFTKEPLRIKLRTVKLLPFSTESRLRSRESVETFNALEFERMNCVRNYCTTADHTCYCCSSLSSVSGTSPVAVSISTIPVPSVAARWALNETAQCSKSKTQGEDYLCCWGGYRWHQANKGWLTVGCSEPCNIMPVYSPLRHPAGINSRNRCKIACKITRFISLAKSMTQT